MLAIQVRLEIKPEFFSKFKEALRVNASSSLSNEDGCLHFFVGEPEDKEYTLDLYEVYKDRTSLEAHHASEHFLNFSQATSGQVTHNETVFISLTD